MSHTNYHWQVFTWLLATLVAAGAVAASDELFLPPPGDGLEVTRPTHATKINYVGVNFDLLQALTPNDKFRVTFYGNDLEAIVDAVRPQVRGYTVRGHFDKRPDSFFVVTVVENAVAGTFYLPGAQNIVRLRYGGKNGLHYFHQVQTGPSDQCAAHMHKRITAGNNPKKQLKKLAKSILDRPVPPPNPPAGPEGGCGPLDPTFDIMLVYSDNARAAAGGTAAIQADCINAVEVTELTYLTCNVLIRTNIVHLAEVNYVESDRSYQDHLDSLIDPSDGVLDGIHATRDNVDADFVSLIVNDPESGGLGRCDSDEDDAMSVCRWDLIVDNFTLAHEIGHNIGCGHDPVTGDNCGFELGWGHFFFVPAEGMWRHTVMSYPENGSTRIPYYSTPDCDYEGVPTGTSTRDNLSVILTRQYTVEAFRQTRMDVWVDFSHNGSENGSHSQPYNTMIEGVNRTLPNPVADIPTLHIKPGSRNESITINKPMTINACGGTVTIGQ